MPPTSSNLKTTALVATSGSTNLNVLGNYSVYGLQFLVGAGVGTNANLSLPGNAYKVVAYNCTFISALTAPSGGSGIQFSSYATITNCTFQFYSASSSLLSSSYLYARGGSVIAGPGGVVPNSFTIGNNGQGRFTFIGFDFSAITGTIFGPGQSTAYYSALDCKFASGVTVANMGYDTIADITCSDSAATNYMFQRYAYSGKEIPDTTVVRTGGASNGTTSYSAKIITNTNTSWNVPFYTPPIAIWNSVVNTNRVVTLYGIWNAAAIPNNDQIWIEVDYLGSNTSTLGSIVNNTKANNLATGTALTADTSSIWNSLATARSNNTSYSVGNTISVSSSNLLFFCTSAGTSALSLPSGYASATDGTSVTDGSATFRAGYRFALTVTLSSPQPQQQGPIYVTINAGLASSTFWVDPLIILG